MPEHKFSFFLYEKAAILHSSILTKRFHPSGSTRRARQCDPTTIKPNEQNQQIFLSTLPKTGFNIILFYFIHLFRKHKYKFTNTSIQIQVIILNKNMFAGSL